jgi:hypothetical protein
MNAARRLFKDSCTDALKALSIQGPKSPNIIDLELILENKENLTPEAFQK